MGYIVSTSPANEPVFAADIMELELHVSDSTESGYIDSLISRVRSYLEVQFDKAIVEQEITETFDNWGSSGCLSLTINPVLSITSVSYVKPDDTTGTLNVATDIFLKKSNLDSRMALVNSAPSIKDKPGAITVVYEAGYETVPDHIKATIIEKVARMYYMREENTELALSHVMTSAHQLFNPERAIMV